MVVRTKYIQPIIGGKMKKIVILLVSLILCYCSTPYQKSGLMGGFSEKKLEDGTYEVSFKGNGYTSKETVVKYMLYRCAELTDGEGYKYFEILSENKNTDSKTYTSFNAGTGAMNTYSITKYGGTLRIKMINEKPEKMTEDIYNAKRFMLMNKDVK